LLAINVAYNPKLLAKITGLYINIWYLAFNDFLEVGTKIETHNNGLLDEGEI